VFRAVSELRIARGLSFPEEAVTQTFGILAVRGAGKTNTAAVLAEQMHAAHLPFVVVDPVGSWWGLRSSFDGKGPGLQVPIFGGLHGDVPLERTAGELLADLVVEERLSCVLDVSEFSEGDKIRFLIDFAERLYRRSGQDPQPLHLFLEEADDYAPQRPQRDQARLLGAWQRVVRRGRARGLGMTMITQRSAALNKDVLTQIETLIVMRTTSPQDRKAIQGWVEYHGQSRELLASLPELESGEAWVWSPHWLGVLKRVKVRRRSTFDSGATPTVAGRKRPPATLADVDLAKLQKRMSATIEKAKAEDPKELRRQIAALQKELRAGSAQPKVVKEIQEMQVPVFRNGEVKRLEGVVTKLADIGATLVTVARDIGGSLESAAQRPKVSAPPVHRAPVKHKSQVRASDFATSSEEPKEEVPLRAGERRMLAALARHHPMRVTRAQFGTLSGFAPRGGTFGTYLGVLKRQGLIEEDGGLVGITEEGLAYLGADAPATPTSTEEMLGIWRRALRRGEREMLEVLVEAYPESVTREELADRTGFTVSGGTFGTYLGVLRRNGLADVSGNEVRASDTLFLSGVPA